MNRATRNRRDNASVTCDSTLDNPGGSHKHRCGRNVSPGHDRHKCLQSRCRVTWTDAEAS